MMEKDLSSVGIPSPSATEPSADTRQLGCEPSSVAPPKRPSRYDAAIIRQAAELMAPAVAEWGESKVDEALITALEKSIRDLDGYQRARNMERHWHCDPDAELVEILSGDNFWTLERDAVRTWVAAYGITLRHPVGSFVQTRFGVGEVMEHRAQDATYTVWTKMSHAPRGRGGFVLTDADCDPVEVEPEGSSQDRVQPSAEGAQARAESAAKPTEPTVAP